MARSKDSASHPRRLLVFGEKTFCICIPADAKVTFGPWSPPAKGLHRNNDDMRGTLRVYHGSKDNALACFADVRGFRDLSLPYSEQPKGELKDALWLAALENPQDNKDDDVF